MSNLGLAVSSNDLRFAFVSPAFDALDFLFSSLVYCAEI